MNEFPTRTSSPDLIPKSLDKLDDLNECQEAASQLAVRLAATTINFTTQWMVEHLKLPHQLVDALLWKLKEEKLLEILGQIAPLTYQYRITNLGLDLSNRLMSLCGYLGPAPVSLQEYADSVAAQKRIRHETTIDAVKKATADLTFDHDILEIATLAYASNRSLFMFGPPGNGKSSLGRMLHTSTVESIWIPYAISVDNQVIRLFDPQYHKPSSDLDDLKDFDHRWIRIESPFVMSGGELTMTELDLVYDRSVNFYEAPPHLKANCGTYFIDDLGRQRIPPSDLLNRWIVPLEQNIDYLTLVNGKKIEVPFQMMLIVATNLEVSEVADAAFLRRMGYRIYLDNPSEQDFRTIFESQIQKMNVDTEPDLLDQVVAKYRSENRQWLASEPRDLLTRCQDVIHLRQDESKVDSSVMDVAWRGYFSNERESKS